MANWSAGEYRTFLRAPAVVELHHMLRVEKAETHGVKNILFQSQRFLPETTACPALITLSLSGEGFVEL